MLEYVRLKKLKYATVLEITRFTLKPIHSYKMYTTARQMNIV
jgi:hypothetical protein